jgi:hypothetical protein
MKLYVYFPFCVQCLFVVLVDTKNYRPNPIPQHLSHLTFMRDMGDKKSLRVDFAGWESEYQPEEARST